MQAEGRGVHEALGVGVEPAGKGGEECRDDEDHQLGTEGVHAHGLGHQLAALERADGPAFAGVEEVLGDQHGDQQQGPDQVVDLLALIQLPAQQRDRRQAADAGMAAEGFQGAEQVVERQAPGDGAQRQVVAGELQRQRAQQQGHRAGERQAHQQGQPG
ncbi:hypothetical protein D3C81_1760400 [compost metagenome]